MEKIHGCSYMCWLLFFSITTAVSASSRRERHVLQSWMSLITKRGLLHCVSEYSLVFLSFQTNPGVGMCNVMTPPCLTEAKLPTEFLGRPSGRMDNKSITISMKKLIRLFGCLKKNCYQECENLLDMERNKREDKKKDSPCQQDACDLNWCWDQQ
jgi:hypothetical protein